MEFEERIERAAALLRRARHAIGLTGAGVSTPSGIPDFRTPGEGLWEQVNPIEVASIHAFRRNPEAFYNWVRPLVKLMEEAEPNPAHRAMARLEQLRILKVVLTQNIDGFHQRAGSQSVLELHGHLRSATCLDCYRTIPATPAMQAVAGGEVPRCPTCGGVVKPDTILFGEQLPSLVMVEAMEHVRSADLVVVAGSSLQVMPVAKIPALVHASGGDVILINREKTYADTFASVVFHEDVAEVLPRLSQACNEEES